MKKTQLKAKKGFKQKTLAEIKAKQAVKKKNGVTIAPKAKKSLKRQIKPNKKKSKPTITKLKAKLWEECKRIIRLRYLKHDGTWDCFTCGNRLDIPAKAQTGHFIPSSVCSTEMRYNLNNLRIQCYRCNINLSGNWIEYEKNLRKEMGKDFPEKLKAKNESTKGKMYREDWFEMYIKNYKEIV
jgi:hypothetical protein